MSTIAVKNEFLPKRVLIGEKDYEVLGYYNANYAAKTGTKPKADTRFVVLQQTEKDAIVTDWPIKRHSSTRYEEIFD